LTKILTYYEMRTVYDAARFFPLLATGATISSKCQPYRGYTRISL
jgi:hypothetical protein